MTDPIHSSFALCEGVELFLLLSVVQYPHHQTKHILSVYVRSVRSECKEVSVRVGRVRGEVRERIK